MASPGPVCVEEQMLNDATLKWLEGRKSMCARCGCYIDHLTGHSSCWDGMRKGWAVSDCKMFYRSDIAHVDFEDAAKFEALVQKRLMYQYEKAVQCAEVTGAFCPSRDIMLMFARIDAEEEMPI